MCKVKPELGGLGTDNYRVRQASSPDLATYFFETEGIHAFFFFNF